jgi:putative ABC transport system permease protein
MGTGDVGLLGLASSLLLVGVAIGLRVWRGLRLERAMVWSVVRAIVQLLLVGGVLALVIDPDRSILWSWLRGAGMLVYAGDVVRWRAPEAPPRGSSRSSRSDCRSSRSRAAPSSRSRG